MSLYEKIPFLIRKIYGIQTLLYILQANNVSKFEKENFLICIFNNNLNKLNKINPNIKLKKSISTFSLDYCLLDSLNGCVFILSVIKNVDFFNFSKEVLSLINKYILYNYQKWKFEKEIIKILHYLIDNNNKFFEKEFMSNQYLLNNILIFIYNNMSLKYGFTVINIFFKNFHRKNSIYISSFIYNYHFYNEIQKNYMAKNMNIINSIQNYLSDNFPNQIMYFKQYSPYNIDNFKSIYCFYGNLNNNYYNYDVVNKKK
jgi:hypothetical protein